VDLAGLWGLLTSDLDSAALVSPGVRQEGGRTGATPCPHVTLHKQGQDARCPAVDEEMEADRERVRIHTQRV
jgi:hypothetical protein